MKQQIGEFLATLRKANGYTQQEIADKLGISNKTLSNWECDKALPDLLLLPALAETYGVTVDEILAGERKSKEEKVLSDKGEKSVLRSKMTRFSAQSWILIGIIALGVIFLIVAATLGRIFGLTVIGIVMWSLSATCLIVGLSVLFALWCGTDCGVDESTEVGKDYSILRRRKLSESLCIVALSFFLLWLFFVGAIFIDVVAATDYGSVHKPISISVEFNWLRIVLTTLGFSIPLTFFLLGEGVHKKAILRWGDDASRSRLAAHRKYCQKVALFGLIPFLIASLIAIIWTLYVYLHFDYTFIGIWIGLLITGIDVIVCCALCLKRQYELTPKF